MFVKDGMDRLPRARSDRVKRPERHAPDAGILRLAAQIRVTALLVVIGALCLVQSDYLFHWQRHIYAPGDAPRTNPLTFLAIVFALAATLSQKPMTRRSRREGGLWCIVLLLAAAFPVSNILSATLLDAEDLGRMGWNTALCLALMASAQILRDRDRDKALALAVLALGPPAVSLPGTLNNVQGFFGSMSLTTTLALLALGLANMVVFARHRKLRGLLRDDENGRLMRGAILFLLALELLFALLNRSGAAVTEGFRAGLNTVEMFFLMTLFMIMSARLARLMDAARRTEKQLLRDLSLDPLTQTATRRAAQHAYENTAGEMRVGVLMVDVDKFKRINDTQGHVAGDAILRAVAEVLKRNVRLTDLVARWGGEEFLVLVRVPDFHALSETAERIRSAVKTDDKLRGDCGVTVSVGGVMIDPRRAPDLQASVSMADDALYQAKSRGRDRVVLQGITRPDASNSDHATQKEWLVA